MTVAEVIEILSKLPGSDPVMIDYGDPRGVVGLAYVSARPADWSGAYFLTQEAYDRAKGA